VEHKSDTAGLLEVERKGRGEKNREGGRGGYKKTFFPRQCATWKDKKNLGVPPKKNGRKKKKTGEKKVFWGTTR